LDCLDSISIYPTAFSDGAGGRAGDLDIENSLTPPAEEMVVGLGMGVVASFVSGNGNLLNFPQFAEKVQGIVDCRPRKRG